jgi:hypothetical protein
MNGGRGMHVGYRCESRTGRDNNEIQDMGGGQY